MTVFSSLSIQSLPWVQPYRIAALSIFVKIFSLALSPSTAVTTVLSLMRTTIATSFRWIRDALAPLADSLSTASLSFSMAWWSNWICRSDSLRRACLENMVCRIPICILVMFLPSLLNISVTLPPYFVPD